jgi:hypothetical protein
MTDSITTRVEKVNTQKVRFVETMQITCKWVRHTCRVTIESDSYRDQCSARIERWDGKQWRAVDTIAAGSMRTKKGLVYESHMLTDFKADRDTLVRLAEDVLV